MSQAPKMPRTKKTTFGPRETQRIIERRKKWVDALRSGKFRQGTKILHGEDGCHCVLGVAEIACKLKNVNSDGGPKMYTLSADCRSKLGLSDNDSWSLAYKNDVSDTPKKSFVQLADIIETLPIVKEV